MRQSKSEVGLRNRKTANDNAIAKNQQIKIGNKMQMVWRILNAFFLKVVFRLFVLFTVRNFSYCPCRVVYFFVPVALQIFYMYTFVSIVQKRAQYQPFVPEFILGNYSREQNSKDWVEVVWKRNIHLYFLNKRKWDEDDK